MILRSVGQQADSRRMLALLIVGGVLAASLVVPRQSTQLAWLILLGVPAILALLWFLRHIEWALLLIIPASLLVPFTVGTGTDTTLHAGIFTTVAVIGIWVMKMLIIEQHLYVHIDRVTLPLICLMIIVLLSLLVGQLPWFPVARASLAAQIGASAVFILSAGIFLAAAHLMYDIKWIKRMTWVFLAIAFVDIMLRIVPGREPVLSLIFRPGKGADGSVFWIWLVTLAVGQALLNRDLHISQRIGLFALGGVTIAVGLTQNRAWASGWLPSMLGFLLLIWLWKPRFGWIPFAGGIGYFIVNFGDILQQVSGERNGELNPWFARLEAWQTVLEATRASPLFGLGPANYYYYVELFGIVGWDQLWYVPFNSHNQYIDIVAQTGIIGLLCFLWFAAALLITAYQLFHCVTDGFTRGFVAGCIAGTAATLFSGILGDWFLPFVYNIGITGMRSSVLFWLFAGSMMSIWYRQSMVLSTHAEEHDVVSSAQPFAQDEKIVAG